MGRMFSGAVLAFLAPLAAAQNQVNMSPGVTEIGADIFELHMLIMWICVVIGVAVFAVMFYSIYAHRKSKGHQASQFHESTKVEVAWTVVPFLILIAMAVPATSTLLEVYDNDEAELDILITGYQWKWKYEYLEESGEPVAFFSNLATSQEEIYNTDKKGDNYLLEVDEPLVIPTNTKVRFLITANDVIHSWWVPEIAVKRDAIPGFINEAWTRVPEEGIYRGQCTELCGAYHGFMPVVVHAVPRAEFDSWMAAKRGVAAAQGQDGIGNAIAGRASVMGDLSSHMGVVAEGVSGTAMQAFGGQLNDDEMAAVLTYQRNALGNNTGDVVQPGDVTGMKKG